MQNYLPNAPASHTKLYGLDHLRALAISFVFIFHYGHVFPSPEWVTAIGKFGWTGVDLFFVLSGYLISKILFKATDDGKNDQKSFVIKNFYIRRALRIFPIYFLFVLASAYLLDDNYIKKNLVYFVTYTANFIAVRDGRFAITHLWSLAVEEQFYLIWPWVIIYTPKEYRMHIIVSAIVLGLVSSVILNQLYGQYSQFLLLPCITSFALGALFAHIETTGSSTKQFSNIILIALPFCLIIFVLHQLGTTFFLTTPANSVIALACIVYVCNHDYNPAARWLFNNNLLVTIGKISYGMYLYHPVLPSYYYRFIGYLETRATFNNTLSRLLKIPPSVYLIHWVLLLAISLLSYYLIEANILHIKKYFNYTKISNAKVQSLAVKNTRSRD